MSMNDLYLQDLQTYSKSFETALDNVFDKYLLARKKDFDKAEELLIKHLSAATNWYVQMFAGVIDAGAFDADDKPHRYYYDIKSIITKRKHKIIVPERMDMLIFGLMEKDINKRIREFISDNIFVFDDTDKKDKDELISYFLEFLDNI